MDEMIRMIVTKTGLNSEQARQVATITVSFLKNRLPAERAEAVDEALVKASETETPSRML